jgi:ketosteroid isomerase-like protein
MRTIIIALAVAVLASGSAAASDETDVMAVVHKWSDAFNRGDSKTGVATCTEHAVIIDDFPPHVWQGSGTCFKWFEDFGAFAAKSEITDSKVSLGKARHLNVESGYAYLVSPTTYTYNKSGKPTKDTGMVTMTLHKTDAGWRITGWAWADQ